jgi:hypothetical protein
MSIPAYAAQTLSALYPSEPTDEGLIPVHEAELAYQLFSELGTVPEFTSFAFTCREQLLTGISDFAESNLPDPATLDSDQLRKVQESFVRYILTSGTKGFKDGIDEIEFEDNPLIGQFVDRRGDTDRIFSYEISNQSGSWISTIRAVLEDNAFSEVLTEILFGAWDYAAKATGKKKNCNAAKSHFCQTPNGAGSCVPLSRQCRYKPQGDVKDAANFIGKQVNSAGAPSQSKQSAISPPKSLTDRPNTGKHSDIPAFKYPEGDQVSYVAQKTSPPTYIKEVRDKSGKVKSQEEISQQDYVTIVKRDFNGNTGLASIGKDARPESVVKGLQDKARQKQIEAIQKRTELSEQEVKDLFGAVEAYTSENTVSYAAIRNVQRGILKSAQGKDLSSDEVQQAESYAKAINQYIETAPTFNGTIYRGMRFDSKDERDQFIQNVSGGYSLEAMSSFSSSKIISKDFASRGEHGILFKVKNRSGVSIRNLSPNPDEDEVMVPKGAKYRIVGAPKKSGKTLLVELEELD